MRLISLEKENGTFRIIRPFAAASERMTALFPPGDTALLLRRDLGFAPVGKVTVIACAAIACVPRVETVDWIASFPSWNILFSTPDGIPILRILRIIRKSGRIFR